MTDRELLELAAKAGGYGRITYCDALEQYAVYHKDIDCNCSWNPLESDGDALRLAVKLGIGLTTDTTYADTISADYVCDDVGMVTEVPANGDVYAATRRAITRAAAEIGRAMKGEING